MLLRRNEEPHKGMLDLPGGYMDAGETPFDCVFREVSEELGIYVPSDRIVHIEDVAGTATWKDRTFAVTNHFFLVDIGDAPITLNNENVAIEWIPIAEVKPELIAFDTNQKFCATSLNKFQLPIERVQELIKQLDASANFNEQRFYRATLDGFIAKIYDNNVLVGLGCIYWRQTILRKQAVVEDMIVDESQRGKGYGRLLLDHLFNWAKTQQVEVIELTSSPYRINANALYQKYGFKLHPTNHYLYQLQ